MFFQRSEAASFQVKLKLWNPLSYLNWVGLLEPESVIATESQIKNHSHTTLQATIFSQIAIIFILQRLANSWKRHKR